MLFSLKGILLSSCLYGILEALHLFNRSQYCLLEMTGGEDYTQDLVVFSICSAIELLLLSLHSLCVLLKRELNPFFANPSRYDIVKIDGKQLESAVERAG